MTATTWRRKSKELKRSELREKLKFDRVMSWLAKRSESDCKVKPVCEKSKPTNAAATPRETSKPVKEKEASIESVGIFF